MSPIGCRAMADNYFSRAVAANVTFGRGPYEDFTCDIVAPVNQGVVLKSSNRADDAHIAFDGAADKIERQLKRYMDRLRERRGEARWRRDRGECRLHHLRRARRRRGADSAGPGDRRRNQGRYSRSQRVRRGDDARPAQHQRADVPQSQAAAHYNMVYRRDDGTIGWVEPSIEVTSAAVARLTALTALSARARLSWKMSAMQLSQFLDFEAIRVDLAAGNKRQLLQSAGADRRRRACRSIRR